MQHELNDQCVLAKEEDWHNASLLPKELYDFYLLKCPYARSDKSSASSCCAIDLADNGWTGVKLHQLMQWVSLKFYVNGSFNFSYLASDNINNSIRELELDSETPCLSHPRCVLQIKRRVTVTESGECKIRVEETYATCLFRHIRNALAHANFAVNENEQILLLDTSSKPGTEASKKKYTFGMVATVEFLNELKELIENEAPNDLITEEMNLRLNNNSHRIKVEKKIAIEDN